MATAKNRDPRQKTKAELDAIKKTFMAVPEGTDTDNIKETDPFEQIATVVPGKPPFEVGRTLWGLYQGTKRVYSDKFSNPKKDEQGRAYRDMHLLENEGNGEKVGIFSVGSLGAALPRLPHGTFLGVRYDGLADKPLKKGHHPPHKFTFLGRGKPIVIDWTRKPEIDLADARTGESGMDLDTDGTSTEPPEGYEGEE